MKIIRISIVVVSMLVLVLWYEIIGSFRWSPSAPMPPTPPLVPVGITLSYNRHEYTVFYYRLHQSEIMSLIPNFAERKPSSEIRLQYDCMALINGGFYTTNETPLGLFSVEDKTYSPVIQSNTFNGFIRKSGNKYLNDISPNYDWILQSGPVLFNKGIPKKLLIKNDETARRSVIAFNSAGSPLLISFITRDQANSGPLLSELPQLIQKLNDANNFDITWAMNLDGGSASAFISSEITLSELNPVGSFLCVK